MQFGLLGSLAVVADDGRSLDLGGNQSRTILAVLLAAAGRVVTAEALVDVLWGDEPPSSAPGTLQSYVSRLRRELEPGRAPGAEARVLLWEPPGYRLAVAAADVDFRRFEALADEGRALLADGHAAESRDVLLEADRLWRGPALVEYRDREFALGLVARLEDRRTAAIEDRLGAELALGRHAAVVGALVELVNAHPLQEGFRGLLALALYRSGRQSEALRALSDARDTLRDELGVDLGRPLQDMESSILAHDPSLDLAPATCPAPASAPSATPPAAAPAAPAPAPDGRLVGRASEVAQLLGALDEAATCLRVALIEGEPGIGKTRLAEEVTAEATRRGALVLWGRTFEGGAAPAMWPWLPPLRALVAAMPDPGGLAPELAGLVSTSGVSGMGAAATGRFAIVEAVADLLLRASAARPIVLVLDDLQWADVESLELLTSVMGRLADAPLLIVGTVRELEVGRNDTLVGTLAVLTRSTGARRLQVRGLASEDTGALVAQTAGGAVDPAAAAAIHARAEGNPFFTTELARLVAGGHGLPAGDVPSGVRDVVRQRLALLPEPTLELLRVAAVIGRDVDLGLLAAAAGRDLDAVLDDLEPATLHRLLVEADQPGVYRFAHALVREVMVDDVSSLRRARLHLRVADALDDVDDNAEILAEHLWQAVPIGVAARAATALERAARVAVRRLAYTTAEDLLQRAVQLRRSVGGDGDGLDAELRAVAFLVSVTGAHRGYPALTGSPLLARGKELAERLDRVPELVNLLWAEWAGVDVACRFDLGDPLAEQLLELADGIDLPLAPILGHTAYGISRWHHGDLPSSSQHLDAARAATEAIPAETVSALLFDLDQLRLSLPFSVCLHDLIGDLDNPEAAYDDLVRSLPGDNYWVLAVSNFAANGALSTGDLPRAERAARKGLAADPDGMFAFWGIAGQCYLGAALALQGDLDTGLPMLDAAWAAYTGIGLRTNGVTLLASRAQALAEAGRLEEAAASAADARRELETYEERYSEPTLLLAEAVLADARGDDAGPAFAHAVAVAESQGGYGIAGRVRATASRLGYGATRRPA